MYDNAKTWIKVAIPVSIFLIGFAIGCFSFRTKESSYDITEIEKDHERKVIKLHEENENLISAFQEHLRYDSINKLEYDKIYEKHRKNRRTGVYDGTIEERIRAIRYSGRDLYGN